MTKERELLEAFANDYWNKIVKDGMFRIFPEDIDSFLATLPEEKEEKWNAVKDTPLENGKTLLVAGINEYGKARVLRAKYWPKFFMCTDDADYEGDAEYNEEEDEYYCPEGWYEWNEYEETHFHIDFEVTHWMPLPEFNPNNQ